MWLHLTDFRGVSCGCSFAKNPETALVISHLPFYFGIARLSVDTPSNGLASNKGHRRIPLHSPSTAINPSISTNEVIHIHISITTHHSFQSLLHHFNTINMTGRKYHSALAYHAVLLQQHFTDAFNQAEKVERVSARVEPSVTERFFVTTSKA